MKNLATALILASLLTVPGIDAASVHAPSAVQSPAVVVLVDLGTESAALHLDVPGIGNASVPNASGRGGIELPNVPNGVHAWSLRIDYPDGRSEHHAGAVSVLDVASLVRLAVQGAASAGRDAALQAEAAATAAQAAAAAAEAARAAAQAIPQDVARSSDLANYATAADVEAWQEAEAEHRRAADAELHAGVQGAVSDVDESVGYLLLVVALGVGLVAWYLYQVRRDTPTLHDRALLQSVAVRLGIDQDAPEYLQALHDLDVQERREGILDRLRAVLLRRPRAGGVE